MNKQWKKKVYTSRYTMTAGNKPSGGKSCPSCRAYAWSLYAWLDLQHEHQAGAVDAVAESRGFATCSGKEMLHCFLSSSQYMRHKRMQDEQSGLQSSLYRELSTFKFCHDRKEHLMGAGGGWWGLPATGEKSAKLLSALAGTRLEYVGDGKSNGLNDPGLLPETTPESALSGTCILGAELPVRCKTTSNNRCVPVCRSLILAIHGMQAKDILATSLAFANND